MPGALQSFWTDKDPDALTSALSKDCEYQVHSKSTSFIIEEKHAIKYLERNRNKFAGNSSKLPLYLSVVSYVNDITVKATAKMKSGAEKKKSAIHKLNIKQM